MLFRRHRQAPLKFAPCGCGRNLVRIDRTAWMRLVPTRRLYMCPLCKNRQFLTRRDLNELASRPATSFSEPAESFFRSDRPAPDDPHATLPYEHRRDDGRPLGRPGPIEALLASRHLQGRRLPVLAVLALLALAGAFALVDLFAE